MGQLFIYEEQFSQGTTYCPGSSVYDNWGTFRSNLVALPYISCTISGSLDATGITCDDPAAVAQIAAALNAGTETNITCNGVVWRIGANCITGCAVAGDDVELNAANTGSDCSCGGNYTLRPCIGNANWGSIGVGGCNAPTQTMKVEFLAPSFAVDAGTPEIINPSLPTCGLDSQAITVKLQNLGQDTLTNVTINYTINGGTPVVYNWTGSVDPQGGCDTVVIDTVNFSNGDDLVVWTTGPNGGIDSLPSNDTASVTLQTGLLGTYQIPGDYATFQAAVTALETFGVCGDVIMNVATGTYDEQIAIGTILGTGPNATVTFQGATGNPSNVTLEFDPSSTFSQNGVLQITGTEYLNFKDMTIDNTSATFSYGRVVVFGNAASHVSFDNCELNGSPTNTTSTNNVVVYGQGVTIDNISFDDCHFIGGSYSFRIFSVSANHSSNISVTNSVLDSAYFYMAYFYYCDSMTFHNNEMEVATPYTGTIYGLYMVDCDLYGEITQNRIYNTGGTEIFRGIYMSGCDGTLNNPLNISNNCVTVGNVGDNDFATSFYMVNSGIATVTNNTFNNLNTLGNGYAHYISGGGLIEERNNSFINYGTGYARYTTSVYSMTVSENNNYHSEGANVIWLNGAHNSVESFSNTTGFDLNSVETDPAYYDTLACATCNDTLDGGGMVVTGIDVDVNGETRSTTSPDIGAVEYIAAGSFDLGGDSTYCADHLLLEAGPAQSVTWNVDGNSASTPTYLLENTGTQPQTFNVSVNILTNGCGPASDNLQITLVPPASLDSTVHICADATETLAPGGGTNAVYSWSNGETTPTIDVSEPGTYSVNVMEDGCESDASIIVTQSQAIEIDDVEPCVDDTPLAIDGTINDGISYAWSDGSTTAVITISQSDDYTVTATDAFGCVSTDSFNVNILEDPVAAITYQGTGGSAYQFSSATSQFIGSNTTYNWVFDNGNTSTQANPFYIFPWSATPVTYNVSLEVDNGCETDDAQLTIVVDPLGIPGIGNVEGFSVFPNPVKNTLFIASEVSWTELQVDIMDMTGRNLSSESFNAGQQLLSMDVSELAAGNYIVRLTADGNTGVYHVIVD